ncbi:MAG: hypothetical protein MUC68_00120 [Burkholderiaceae bacterium]|jgi:cation transport ATPase|nr:hypothetical protein [Burkholderiaceae bacterium]
MSTSVEIVSDTHGRLRLRLASAAALDAARAAVQSLPGVYHLRAAVTARSLVIHHDGRRTTREALLHATSHAAPLRPAPATRHRRRLREALPPAWPMVAAALAPALPPAGREAAALVLLASRSLRSWRRGDDLAASALDAVSLATTALTGHPLTATTALLVGSLAERRRDHLLLRFDALLDAMVPAPAARWRVARGRRTRMLALDDIAPGDLLTLAAGDVVPVDGLVVDGTGRTFDGSERDLQFGARVPAGERLLRGSLRVRAERVAAESRSARLRSHVRHLVHTRDAPGALTPDLERLIAVPMTAAGLVLALTGDAERTASMLQADPQLGVAMAQPVAREAAVLAAGRDGALLMGLEPIDRLARATAIAFEDVGVLAAPLWHIDNVQVHEAHIGEDSVRTWLASIAGHGDACLLAAGLLDVQVARWREHGVVLRSDNRLLHIGGAAVIARTWRISMADPDRRSLVRRLGIVCEGRLLATIHLRCELDVERVRAAFVALRAQGVRRIAVFTEDVAAAPAAALLAVGADAVISSGRASQARWLAQATEHGEAVALVHTGLRDLLPPGGLSLCPVDTDTGAAHGVLIGDPLAALVRARSTAIQLRRRLRLNLGVAVSANALLMIAAAMRWMPPLATTLLKHGVGLALLESAARLRGAHDNAPTVAATHRPPTPTPREGVTR